MNLRKHFTAIGSWTLALVTSSLFISSSSEAARVVKVKEKQILIDVETTDIREGEKYFIIIDGKKKGVVLISQVKNGKALGKLTKGKAEADALVEPTGKARTAGNGADGNDDDILKKGKKSKRAQQSPDEDSGEAATIVGVIAGIGMDSQNVTFSNGTSLAMSGMGYSLKGYGDIPLGTSLGLIARSGIEQFNVASGNASTSIMYLTVDALLRYSFMSGGFVPYVAGGMGIHFPVTKSSTNALDAAGISSSTVFFGTLGFNWKMGETSYILGMGEYGFFPPSNSVTTNMMAVRIGYGWNW